MTVEYRSRFEFLIAYFTGGNPIGCFLQMENRIESMKLHSFLAIIQSIKWTICNLLHVFSCAFSAFQDP